MLAVDLRVTLALVLLASPACARANPSATEPGATASPAKRDGSGCGQWLTAATGPVEFLDGRVRVQLPADFEVRAAASTNLMAAPTSLQRRSTIAAEIPGSRGKAELILVGQEMFATRPASMDDYLDRAGGFIGHDGPMRAVDITGAPTFWGFRPETFAAVDEVTTVTASLVDLGDGLMLFMGVGIAGDARRVDLDSCAELAVKLLASAEQGSRAPDWSAADHVVPTPGGEPLTAARPAGWAAFTNAMYDHSVTYFIELQPLGSGQPASVTVYVGHHSDPVPSRDATVERRTIAGREVDWYSERDGELTIGLGVVERALDHDLIVLHTLANSPASAAAIDSLVSSLRVGE